MLQMLRQSQNLLGIGFILALFIVDGFILVEEKGDPDNMVWLDGGRFTMGSDHGLPDEAPARPVSVSGFWIDKYEVTNAQYEAFVAATDYVTGAEQFGDSLVFHSPQGRSLRDVAPMSWWLLVRNASWRSPEGTGETLPSQPDHPVVQVNYEDALAYCNWQGKTLPTEAQYEFAARGGRDGQIYSWGDQPIHHTQRVTNYWQGEFPVNNENTDGHHQSAPVGSYPANDFGLYDITGNVWEWVSDWYHPNAYTLLGSQNPKGVKREESLDPAEPGLPKRSIRGGSFLCSENYCQGFRVSARMPADPDSATNHTGFRCVAPRRSNRLTALWLG